MKKNEITVLALMIAQAVVKEMEKNQSVLQSMQSMWTYM